MPKKKKKHYKKLTNIAKVSLVGAGSAVALGAVGGASATHGQQGIANATRYLRPAGTVVGAGMLMGSLSYLDKATKKKRRR